MRETRSEPKISRAYPDVRKLSNEPNNAEIVDKFNTFVDTFNFLSKFLTLGGNFDGKIAEVVIPATTSIQVQHFLGIVPKYRLILRQEGNGVITDIPSGWTDKYITLLNNGSVEVRVTLLIARE